MFAYSMAQKGSLEVLNVICEKNAIREIEGVINTPEQVYVSYCESYFILAYDRFFIIHKVQ